jgi:hypothetical protein
MNEIPIVVVLKRKQNKEVKYDNFVVIEEIIGTEFYVVAGGILI